MELACLNRAADTPPAATAAVFEAKRASFFHGVDATAGQLACAAQRRSAPCRVLDKLVALAVAHATSAASRLSLVVLTRACPASALCSSAERRQC